MTVLPRRAWRGRMIADTHCANAMGVGWAEGSVAVADEMKWRFIPRESVCHLPSDPLLSWIGSDADRDQPPAGVTQDHQAVEQLERDSTYDEQVQRSDATLANAAFTPAYSGSRRQTELISGSKHRGPAVASRALGSPAEACAGRC